jgi:hypothetical protein
MQHAFLHGLVMLHDPVHTPPVHACPVGQSPRLMQPQVPSALHTGPEAWPVQSVQRPPAWPQVRLPIPQHMPPAQQPPLHGEEAEQPTEQAPFVQAWRSGQSLGPAHCVVAQVTQVPD